MGKKGKWLSSLKKAFSPKSKETKNQISKEQFLEKQVHLGFNGCNVATLETIMLSSPRPEEVDSVGANAEQGKQTYPVAVSTAAAPSVEVVRCQLPIDARFAGKSKEEVAAIKIQSAFRVYLAKRALHALKGLIRLKSLMEGPVVKRQAASTLRCMQAFSGVQCQIRIRRIRMTEENRAFQRQLLQKHAKEIVNLQMGEDWDDSLQSKEQIEASLLSKHKAAMRRERAMAYSFTHQQTWKNGSRSMNRLFMDANNPSWGWSWLERWMAARPWEGHGTTEKGQNNDRSSVKSAYANFGREISNAYARYQLNSDKQSPKAGQKTNQCSTAKPASATAQKLKSASPKSSVFGPDDDARSIASLQSERNRRHSIAGSLVHDNERVGSSPWLPSYMVPTESARAKTRLQSHLGLEANGTPEKGPIVFAKKRLSYPLSPARPRQQHLCPPKVHSSITNIEVAVMSGKGN
ncbi:IQ-domain 2 [Hibiscus trionum]|uniref:IQ-domain 2 n=1 Tax=Hibiscus trionum TaxID=183268 RepID=A0A9W7IM22_HIBTR|nr:IQ-domain 2 [Hibiscus trionum]